METYSGQHMSYYHKHNLVRKEKAGSEKVFGIQVNLAADDTFTKLIGEEWETTHWYTTESERDDAFKQMSERHGYYRNTDSPTHILKRISR